MQLHLSIYNGIGRNTESNLKLLHSLPILDPFWILVQSDPAIIFWHIPASLAYLEIGLNLRGVCISLPQPKILDMSCGRKPVLKRDIHQYTLHIYWIMLSSTMFFNIAGPKIQRVTTWYSDMPQLKMVDKFSWMQSITSMVNASLSYASLSYLTIIVNAKSSCVFPNYI